jgi:hypothetical protein
MEQIPTGSRYTKNPLAESVNKTHTRKDALIVCPMLTQGMIEHCKDAPFIIIVAMV